MLLKQHSKLLYPLMVLKVYIKIQVENVCSSIIKCFRCNKNYIGQTGNKTSMKMHKQ